MRKLFFVKKNVNEPTGASNWIEMNVDEFNEFISTEEGKANAENDYRHKEAIRQERNSERYEFSGGCDSQRTQRTGRRS